MYQAPTSPYEAAWQQWNYGGGGMRGEPMPRPEDYPDDGSDGGYGGMSPRKGSSMPMDHKPAGNPYADNAPPLVRYDTRDQEPQPSMGDFGGYEPPPRDDVPMRDESGGGMGGYSGGGYSPTGSMMGGMAGQAMQSPAGRGLMGGMAGQAMKSPAGRGLMGGLVGAGIGRLFGRRPRRPQSLAAMSRGEQE